MGGMNFAFSAGITYYHSPEDTPGNLDPRSLQHQGENALAMTRQLGQLDLDNPKRDDVIYTSILNRIVVYYSKAWALSLAVIATGLFAGGGSDQYAIRTDAAHRSGGHCGRALRGYVDILPDHRHRGRRGNLLVRSPRSFPRGIDSIAEVRRDAGGRVCVGYSDDHAFIRALVGELSIADRALPGRAYWWLILSLATALWLPGASYLFVWPTLAGLVGLGIKVKSRPGSVFAWFMTLLCSIPSLLLLPPLIRTTFNALSLDTAAPTVMILVVLFIGTTLPLLGPLVAREISPRQRTFNS